MRLICHKHNDEEIVAICPKCYEKNVLENIVKEINGKIKNSNTNFEWINGMLDAINIINKRIRELDK